MAYAAVDGKDIHPETLFGNCNMQVQLTVIHRLVGEAQDSAEALSKFMAERGAAQ